MRTTHALQASHGTTDLTRIELRRRDLRPDDVAVRVTHCGVCHTDLHALRALATTPETAPLVPGHELTGVVSAVGNQVHRFVVGQRVAVGNIVDSCGRCRMCRAGQENFCIEFPTLTYGGLDRVDGSTTQGGWAGEIVVREAFTYALPDGLDPAAAAPLLCAGVTVWEPLRALGVGPGTRVGIVGLGGLGHLAVKLAAALGATVTALTRSPAKTEDARTLGATHVLLTTDATATAQAAGSLDVILDTVSAPHDPAPLLALLDLDGALCWLGDLGHLDLDVMSLLVGRKRVLSAGSGGRPATQELLDFCAEHGITADVEVLPASRALEALERLGRGDVRYRFVLDTSELTVEGRGHLAP